MNRRTLMSRALALLGVGAVGVPAVLYADPIPARPGGAIQLGYSHLEQRFWPTFARLATWRDLRGGAFWLHTPGWSWTSSEHIEIIPDDDHFSQRLFAWVNGQNFGHHTTGVGMDLRTYDILARRSLFDKMENGASLLLGHEIYITNRTEFVQWGPTPGFDYGAVAPIGMSSRAPVV